MCNNSTLSIFYINKIKIKNMIINLKSQNDLSGFYVVWRQIKKTRMVWNQSYNGTFNCKALDHLQEDFDRDGIDWNAYTLVMRLYFT
jgi:hypothetical protein